MALVLDTNCGFCLNVPTIDPAGTNTTFDNNAVATRLSSPGCGEICSLGVWIDNSTEAGDICLGIYSDNIGGTQPDILLASVTIAKGTTSGWKIGTLSTPLNIFPNRSYWIAVEVDNTATTTNSNYVASAQNARWKSPATELTNPWGTSGGELTDLYSVYAFYKPFGTGTKSSRFLKTNYPFTSGLIAETTSQTGHVSNLIPENSLVLERDMVGVLY